VNSSNATALDRADIGFQDIGRGTGNIVRIVFSRSLLRLLIRFLPLLMLAAWGVSPAHANGVNTTIGSGQVVSGSVTYSGEDDYTFPAKTGNTIFVSVSEVGTHSYEPHIELDDPSMVNQASTFDSYFTNIRYYNATAGTWTVKVSAWGGGAGGSYKLTVITIPGAYSVASGNAGGAMYPGETYAGSIYRGDVDIYTFNAVAGVLHDATLTVDITGGAWDAAIRVFYPDGSDFGGGAGNVNYQYTVNLPTVSGPYTVVVYKWSGADATDSYSLSVSGNVALPGDAKADGSCATCQQMAAKSPPVSADGRAAVGLPINVATGNMYEQVTDYTTVGTNPLALTRTYNSLSYTRNLYTTLMGPNWRTNYDRYLRVSSSTQAAAERPDGRVINFALSGGSGTPDTDVDVKLTYSGGTYTLTDSDDTVETYTVTSGKGTLNSIAWPNGYTQTLNYTSGVLTSVSDSYSRSLSFSYTSSMLTGVTTPDSATLTYGYTTTAGQSLLTSVTYNTSPTTSQTYVYGNSSLPFAMTSITDENGNTNSQWAYDGAGRATSSQHAGGADLTQVSYDDSTGNRTVTGPLGNAETYKFTTAQGISKVSEIDRAAAKPVASASRYFTYDSNGYLATATDWDGNSTHWTNNSHGLPTSITEAYGAGVARTTSVSYDSTWVHKPYTTTKTGETIDDRYDGTTGTLTTHTLTDTTGGATNGQTHIWAYTYNGTGERLTETFPRTGTTVKNTYTYTSGALASITDQLSHTTTINTANGTGQPTEITDPNSVVTDLVYNNRNWLTSKTVHASPSNEVTGITYTSAGALAKITLPDSIYDTITYAYDNAQRLTTITNGAGETINYTLNAAGKPTTTEIKDSGGTVRKSSTATYDAMADRVTLTGGSSPLQTTLYFYDNNQHPTYVADANSRVWGQGWDALNRPAWVSDPDNNIAIPTYNNLGYVTAQTDFNGYSTSFTRDAFGNAIARSSPDTGASSFTWDEDNNLTAWTDARGVASTQGFDAADRITFTSHTGYAAEHTAYTYDSTASGNKGVGRLTSVSDESGSTSFKYDSFGNIILQVRVIGGKTYNTTYSYDLANRATEMIYPSGRYVDYTYSSAGYLTTVTTNTGGGSTTLASSITHKPFGPIATFTYGNSEAQTRTYDNNYWLTALSTVYSGTYVQHMGSINFDSSGNLTGVTDSLNSGRSQTFLLDRLTRLQTATGDYGSRTYSYDKNSNRLTWYDGTLTATSHYNTGANIPGSITYSSGSTRSMTYTSAGNLATDNRGGVGSLTNTYGGRDRLEQTAVSGGATTTYKINALGQRVSKASGATTHFIYDINGRLIAEADGSTGATTIEYVYMEGKPLAQIDSSGNIFYIHTDLTGAPEKITNASRTLVWDQIREPFGGVYFTSVTTTPTNLRFPGQYADSEDSLNQNWFRDYDPTLGRYVQADPIGFAGGLNLFGYAAQNPTQRTDRLGFSDDEIPTESVRPLNEESLTETEEAANPYLRGGLDFTPMPEEKAPLESDPMDIANVPAKIAEINQQESAGQQCVSRMGTVYGSLGTVVANPNIQASGFTPYSQYRADTRDVTLEMINSTVSNPVVVLQQSSGRYLFLSNQAAVVLSPSGRIVTTYSSAQFDPDIMAVLSDIK
jgi:RHS repeat-associated protein